MTATRSLSASLQHLNRVLCADELAALPDAELVGRFVERRDEAAFAALVRRYGAVVFGVCRRVLRHEQDAEDAFQATFLVFARDAARVTRAGGVGNWLYGVAHNAARKARAARHRRETKERTAAAKRPAAVPTPEPNDLSDILDAELGRLPDKYRAPIVLCDLMGLTTGEAAAEVGCPPKTLGTRLARGRLLLAGRLTRRGVAVPAGVMAAVLAPFGSASAAVAPRVLGSASRLAVLADPAGVPPGVAALTRGVSNVMTYASLKYAVLACAILVAGAATRPLVRHLHAGPGRGPATTAPAGAAAAPTPPTNYLDRLHRFFIELLHPEATTAAADDKKDEKPKPLAGTWVKKEGELKVEFAETEMKLYPHGDNKVLVVVCSYTFDKDGAVKAKVTGHEGKEEAKKVASEKLPVGSEFGFTWKAAKGAATLEGVKGEKADFLKSHLEGGFEEKK